MDKCVPASDKAPSHGLGKDLLKIFMISGFFVSIALVLQNSVFRTWVLNSPLLRELFLGAVTPGHVWWHAFLFVVTFSLLIGIGLPRLWASAIGGMAFGALWGTLLALAASVAGAAFVYLFGRTLLAGILHRRIGPRLATWQERFEQNAFWWVLYIRLFPLSNATLAGLICGACRISPGAYLAGSFLGFIPLTAVFAVFGSGGAGGNFYQLALGTVLLLLVFGGRKLLTPAFRPRTPWCG